MKSFKNTNKKRITMALAAMLVLASSPLYARVDLVAREGTWTPAGGGSPITMWGYYDNTSTRYTSCAQLPATWAWEPGPQITESLLQANGNLRIRLLNCLNEPVSVMIPGQKAIVVGNAGAHPEPERNAPAPPHLTSDPDPITSFTTETAAGATLDYLWYRVLQAGGSNLYMSGTHPAKQVHMGLYGALKVGTYENTSGDITLLYSEIDPALHDPPQATTPLGYKPRYFLVNGKEEFSIAKGDTSAPVVLSFFNAGLDFHVPALTKGYMTLMAEDGNPYPAPEAKEQYSVNLAAGKTIDAFWQPASAGDYVIYDRRGNNMITRISVGAGAGAPVAAADSYSTSEDTLLAVGASIGLLFNDTGLPNPAMVELVSAPSAGTLSCPAGGLLCADGSFNYQPNLNFIGTDSFTYRVSAGASNPASNVATVSITVTAVNDPPVAVDDSYDAVVGVTLVVPAPGVLANDSDPDNDAITVTGGPVNPLGDFSYLATTEGTQFFDYTISDGNGGTASARVTINVTSINDVPVAVDDSATVQRNSSANDVRNTFSILANDTDANGLNLASVLLSSTSMGGTVTYNGDGTVTYVPVRRWRGTDTFTYTVEDTAGARSNMATVRVNVVRARDLPPL